MAWTVSGLSVVVFTGAVLCTSIGIVALQKRPDPMAWPLAVLMFAGTLWAIPHALSFGFTDVDQVVFLNRLVYPSASLVPVAYLVLALTYAGYERWLSWRVYAGLCLLPAVTVVAVWTNPAHGLFWESVAVEQVSGASTLEVVRGPLLWVNLLYSYLLVAVAWGVFANVVLNAGPIYRNQALLMLFGGIIPTALNVMFNFGIGLFPAVDLTSSALAVSGAAFALALFRYDLLGLTPAAYRSVPDLFEDGVLVFDEQQRLVETNDHAEEILGTTLEIGMVTADVFDEPLETLDGTVLTAGETNTRMYTVRCAPLHDQRQDAVGHAVVMREVTELKEHQQRLSVTNRVLRHNLRNELNIILGVAEQIDAAATSEQTQEAFERLRAAATRLDDVGEKARHIQSSLSIDEESLLVVDAIPTVENVIEQYQREYPDAEITVEKPERTPVLAAGTGSLETVVRNLVENALEHNDSDQPTVEMTVSTHDDTVVLQVADNGPGIPPEEYEVLGEPTETQLQHGSSLGLWLTYWLVTAMDGDIEFETNEPRGAVVTLRLQAPENSVERSERTANPETVRTD